MVAVLHAGPRQPAPEAIAEWLRSLQASYSQADVEAIASCISYAQERCANGLTRDGEPMLDRALGTATILAGLKLDSAAIRASLLIGAPYVVGFDLAELVARFGSETADLVVGVARMDEIRAETDAAGAAERAAQAERLRKMLLAMVEDIRVVLIKLAERTQASRYLSQHGTPELRQSTAREVLDLFAPLANRLGIWQLKWELEDLSLRAIEPEVYKSIASQLDERRLDRQRYIADVLDTLTRELANEGIRAQVTGRPKHIYSIWSKMRRKQAGIDAVYDIRAVRILVDDIKDCYAALGVVHHLWTPLPGEFDDYIAKPKANDYRSLHTAVIGPEEKPLEVQIRTVEMHQHSEYGVAAHWRYKEAGPRAVRRDPAFEDRIAWLRQVLDWKDTVADASDWLAAFKSSLFVDTIYVLTPQGKVIDLPSGSTPIDFAYAVHTNLGHRCRGARVNGAMVPLNTALRNGQQVEVITVKQGGPSRDWLNPELGFVHSHRARTKLRQWFNAQQHEETVAQGRSIVERELQRAGATGVNLDSVAAQAGVGRAEDLFTAAAREEINVRQLQVAIRAVTAPAAPLQEGPPKVETRQSRAASSGRGILVVGIDRLMTALARCCKPAPPDPIVGFVTRGKGVTIHRQKCASVERLRSREPERLIAADWGESRDDVFPVDIVIEAMDRQGLLRDATEVLSRERINVTAANTLTRNMQSRMAFTVEVRSLEHLQRALALIRDLPGVVSASRR
ncbi:MAG: bifunctional (p)ppGpp synthetase/guanosine-3',5'-bis(diphosphate) 3'-pyrophosphohydrolase [Pseudomonadota bacterium]|nr:bifunctional (p)ppGpp synthetase/guanosine-3',5'-bis(diphosphate) 3'-pyrophosphohydrolase [Pseudomonadota bacterium]